MPSIVKGALSDRRFALAFSAAALLCALAFACPAPAFADIAGDINAWLCGILRDTCNWIFSSQADMLKSIGAGGVLSSGFEQMLGSAGTVTMYDLVRGVWEHAILPIGCGMLSFVFTVQLIKVSQRMDGNASIPGVKEVVFMLVFFAVSIATTDDDVAALIAMLVVALVSWLVVIVAYVVALVVSWARAIQIYVMAAFSPIPLALTSLDETRQMGVGYLKNFVAVCLAGLIILVLLVSFPIVLGGLDAASAGVPVVDSIVGGLSYALQYLAMCVLLILSLVKSGSWARDIMGG